jgi:hypothetical protein
MAKNALVMGLNSVTNESLNNQLQVLLRKRGEGSLGTGEEYMQSTPEDRWELATFDEVLDILRKGRIVPRPRSKPEGGRSDGGGANICLI